MPPFNHESPLLEREGGWANDISESELVAIFTHGKGKKQ